MPAASTLHSPARTPAAALVDLRFRFAGELVEVEAVLGRAWGGT